MPSWAHNPYEANTLAIPNLIEKRACVSGEKRSGEIEKKLLPCVHEKTLQVADRVTR